MLCRIYIATGNQIRGLFHSRDRRHSQVHQWENNPTRSDTARTIADSARGLHHVLSYTWQLVIVT
eukprot:9774943-Ditylum_brightwellii.AAC.1